MRRYPDHGRAAWLVRPESTPTTGRSGKPRQAIRRVATPARARDQESASRRTLVGGPQVTPTSDAVLRRLGRQQGVVGRVLGHVARVVSASVEPDNVLAPR